MKNVCLQTGSLDLIACKPNIDDLQKIIPLRFISRISLVSSFCSWDKKDDVEHLGLIPESKCGFCALLTVVQNQEYYLLKVLPMCVKITHA